MGLAGGGQVGGGGPVRYAGNSSQVQTRRPPPPPPAPTGPNARVKVSAAKAQVREATHCTDNLWNLIPIQGEISSLLWTKLWQFAVFREKLRWPALFTDF